LNSLKIGKADEETYYFYKCMLYEKGDVLNDSKKHIRYLILTLTWPAIIEYALQTVGSYVNYMMVGRLGIQASAIVGLNFEVNFLVKGMNMAIGIGILVYIAKAVGEGDALKIQRGTKQGVLIAVIVGVLQFIVMMLICPLLPNWLGADKAIQQSAIQYFLIIYAPILFISLNIIIGSMLKAAGDMRTPMYVNVFMNIANIILNFLLIYDSHTYSIGRYSIHIIGANLNVLGAAIATSIAAVFGGILMVIGLYKNKTVAPGRLTFIIDRPIINKFMVVGTPVLFSRIISSMGRVLFTVLIAGLGTTAFAAHSIAFTAESAFYIPVIGFQTAVTTIASITAGENNQKKLNRITSETIKMTAGIMILMGLILFEFSKQIMGVFTKDLEVITIGSNLLRIVSINEPLFAVYVVLEGIFNGIGKTRIPLKVSIITLWCIRVTGTLICLKLFKFGIYSAWICMIADNIIHCILLVYCYIKGQKNLLRR